jgi:hypothetical protein
LLGQTVKDPANRPPGQPAAKSVNCTGLEIPVKLFFQSPRPEAGKPGKPLPGTRQTGVHDRRVEPTIISPKTKLVNKNPGIFLIFI